MVHLFRNRINDETYHFIDIFTKLLVCLLRKYVVYELKAIIKKLVLGKLFTVGEKFQKGDCLFA